ncbi:outer membrane beta-barrel protein [Dyadobacter fanqingshengii]|uniref:Outer membrane beta-barrel protein n=1 Tax=Dyadobacter fanqingshengii TaxID=2906443 RepID=A0A9X1PC51_9BACT|nr:outer membrane beta-barrel protein [Dyadobacter fanqingshengii]MCF0041489.1 outer membrane beta-barrel protein [Dyadobacter fanqingshengii]USJ36792.1 outer membrane beta-barrel protein [Dyadobacter fanqingshengii]
MKTKLATHVLAAMLFSAPVFAQVISKDSLQALNDQKKAIEFNEKLNEKKIELAEKQKELEKKRAEMQQSSAKAQASVDANTSVARELAANPQDKKLSRKASGAARDAQRDAKNARKDSDRVDQLNEDIANLQKEIQEKEQEFASNRGLAAPALETTAAGNPAAGAPAAGSPAAGAPVAGDPGAGNSGVTQNGGVVQGASVMEQNRNAPYIVQRNMTSDANGAGTGAVAQRVLESTYKNYPQQPGQPTIIINNIIVPSEYNAQQPKDGPPAKDRIADQDLADYEDYKAWLRYKKGLPATPGSASYPAASGYPAASDKSQDERSAPMDKDARLGFRDRFGEKPERNSGMWVIPMVGIHASNFNADFQDDQYEGRAGWNAGLDFRFRMRKFFIQPGVHYFSSSMNVTSEDSISTAPLLTGPRIHSLKAPLMIGVYLTKAKGGFFRFNIKGGVVGNYVLNVDQNGSDRFDKDNIEDFSYGLNAGVGLEFGFVTLDFSHEWGMSALFKDSNQKNNILRATLGFKL